LKIQDLIFIAVFLGTVVSLFRAGILALKRQYHQSRRVLLRAGIFLGAYLLLVMGTSLATPMRWIEIGEEQRFDDWALTVLQVDHAADRYHVMVRVTSHARGRVQRAADASLELVAKDGTRFRPVDPASVAELRRRLEPGESFETALDYDVPPGTEAAGLDVIHGAFPALFIIGERGSLLGKRPLVNIE